jgi:hypothetical protein
MSIEGVLQSKLMQAMVKPLVPTPLRRSYRKFDHWWRFERGFVNIHWLRITYIEHWKNFLSTLPTKRLSLLEVSPGPVSMWRDLGWGSYTSVQYPPFDITKEALQEKFDVIIAEQVFEHLRHPYAAARNIHAMLKDSGVFMIATPFLVRVHNEPGDYTRWTEMGIAGFLEDTGFTAETHSWGNEVCAIANFREWEMFRKGRDLRNEPSLPLSIWAYARKSAPSRS